MVVIPFAMGIVAQVVGLKEALGLLCLPVAAAFAVLWRERGVVW
jgi:hypothetical protein